MVVTCAEPPRKHRARPDPPGGRALKEVGQATVEFVALLPILALAALVLGQATVAGWTAWSAAGAARVSARAEALGENPAAAARHVLPRMLGRRARVSLGRAGSKAEHRATVRLHIPVVVPGIRLGTVSASAEVPNQEGA